MENSTHQQLAEMMEEIYSIKNILHQKKPSLRVVLHPKHLRLFMLFTGFAVSAFSLVFYYLEQRYGSFSVVPFLVKQVYMVLATLVGAGLLLLFILFGSRSLRKDGVKQSAAEAFFSFRVLHMQLPIRLIAFILILYCSFEGMAYYDIPILALAIGLQFNFLGCITETKTYIISGYWFMATAVVILLSTSIPGSLAVLLSLGCGSLLFGLLPTPEN